ncbi:unnamed protein product [Echinostoma caproni]|uniref:ATP-binding cassette sub-family F member 2 n=1 Tax=Echinostoma caproni TaxID=27848 RepID=A0A183AED7_9TREM|nr:unnamed protein product [Echinostoma caproni]
MSCSDDENEAVHKALIEELECLDLVSDRVAAYRSVTGVLVSHPEARDIKFANHSITFHGREILTDTQLELNVGRRYGLIGPNGCGKSTLLAVIANREIPIPEHVDIFLLQREMAPSDKTALQCVMEVDVERQRLEKEASELSLREDSESHERLLEVYERLEHLDADKAEAKAARLLHGLGFTTEMQQKQVKHFSGGWRMRIALARALFVRPSEPTNHLDLNACVWLERELVQYPRCLVVVSHSQDFLNGVCNNVILMHRRKLQYFGDYIARFGHGSKKLARQAQSKEKVLAKMIDGGLAEKVESDKTLTFYFPDPGTIPPPVIQVQQVSFRYSPGKPWIYKNLDLAIDLDRRVALVGPNGAGKSTLLKLIAAELDPTDGLIRRHSHVRIGRYHQHLHEMLDINMTAVDWMMSCYPEIKERDDMRKLLGRYGLSGAQQVCPIRTLSDGQRCRIIFAWLAQKAPHLLLLDEPTNHLDIETIDSLADAIEDFEGGLLLVSHDFRLISQVAKEIWVCENQTITPWDGDIFSYKRYLVKTVNRELAKLQATMAIA